DDHEIRVAQSTLVDLCRSSSEEMRATSLIRQSRQNAFGARRCPAPEVPRSPGRCPQGGHVHPAKLPPAGFVPSRDSIASSFVAHRLAVCPLGTRCVPPTYHFRLSWAICASLTSGPVSSLSIRPSRKTRTRLQILAKSSYSALLSTKAVPSRAELR